MVEDMGLPTTWKEMCKCQFDTELLENFNCNFYKQVLQSWYDLYSKPPTNVIEVRSQRLWLNRFIQVNNKPMYEKILIKKSVNYINDILDNVGNYITLNQLNNKFSTDINVMKYNSIKDAIPQRWRKIVKNSHGIQVRDEIKIQINNIDRNIESITSKEFYWHYINSVFERGTALSKWEELCDLVHFEWEDIFAYPIKLLEKQAYRACNIK